MPYHIQDGDIVDSQPGHVTPESKSGSLCTGSDTDRFESVDSDKKGTSSDVYLMRNATKKIQNLDEQRILLLIQVSWVGMLVANLNYLAQIGPPVITIEVFETRKIGHGYLSFTAKDYHQMVKR